MFAARIVAAAAASLFVMMTSPSRVAAQAVGAPFYDRVPDHAFAVTVEIWAKPNKEHELREATRPLIDAIRASSKTVLYFLQEDRDAPGHLVFYEIFASEADFQAHNAIPGVREWFARLPMLTDGRIKVTRMEVLSTR